MPEWGAPAYGSPYSGLPDYGSPDGGRVPKPWQAINMKGMAWHTFNQRLPDPVIIEDVPGYGLVDSLAASSDLQAAFASLSDILREVRAEYPSAKEDDFLFFFTINVNVPPDAPRPRRPRGRYPYFIAPRGYKKLRFTVVVTFRWDPGQEVPFVEDVWMRPIDGQWFADVDDLRRIVMVHHYHLGIWIQRDEKRYNNLSIKDLIKKLRIHAVNRKEFIDRLDVCISPSSSEWTGVYWSSAMQLIVAIYEAVLKPRELERRRKRLAQAAAHGEQRSTFFPERRTGVAMPVLRE